MEKEMMMSWQEEKKGVIARRQKPTVNGSNAEADWVHWAAFKCA